MKNGEYNVQNVRIGDLTVIVATNSLELDKAFGRLSLFQETGQFPPNQASVCDGYNVSSDTILSAEKLCDKKKAIFNESELLLLNFLIEDGFVRYDNSLQLWVMKPFHLVAVNCRGEMAVSTMRHELAYVLYESDSYFRSAALTAWDYHTTTDRDPFFKKFLPARRAAAYAAHVIECGHHPVFVSRRARAALETIYEALIDEELIRRILAAR